MPTKMFLNGHNYNSNMPFSYSIELNTDFRWIGFQKSDLEKRFSFNMIQININWISLHPNQGAEINFQFWAIVL